MPPGYGGSDDSGKGQESDSDSGDLDDQESERSKKMKAAKAFYRAMYSGKADPSEIKALFDDLLQS